MIWPLGNFYQEAKGRSLTALTVGIKANPRHWVPLTDWRRFSSIRVVSATKNTLDIECNEAELRSSLVAEIEAWADHELEMRAQIFRSCAVDSGAQESWFMVSVYYWSVFSACLLLRLLGAPVFRMASDDLKTLKGLLPSTTIFPIEGAFRLTQLGSTSATMEVVRLSRLKSNYHQALWTALYSSLSEIQLVTKSNNSNRTEKDLVAALLGALNSKNAMLSDFRNLVNYRSEIGFPATVRGVGFSTFAEVRGLNQIDSTRMFLGLSASAAAVKDQSGICFDAVNARFMFWTALTLSVLAVSLYDEVSSVIRFDSSWAKRRAQFGNSDEVGVPGGFRTWGPFVKG